MSKEWHVRVRVHTCVRGRASVYVCAYVHVCMGRGEGEGS